MLGTYHKMTSGRHFTKAKLLSGKPRHPNPCQTPCADGLWRVARQIDAIGTVPLAS